MDETIKLKFIKPVASGLIETNVVNDDTPAWNKDINYSAGAEVVANNTIFFSRKNNNQGFDPLKFPLYWGKLRSTNLTAQFDGMFFSRTEAPDEINQVFTSPFASLVAFAGLEATEIEVILYDEDDSEIMSVVESLSYTPCDTWQDYFQNMCETGNKRTSAVVYFPLIENKCIDSNKARIIIRNPGAIAKVGTIEIGTSTDIGCELYGTTLTGRRVKTPLGKSETVLDAQMSVMVNNNFARLKVEELIGTGDKFHFFIYDNGKEVLCAKVTESSTTKERGENQKINFTLEGLTNGS